MTKDEANVLFNEVLRECCDAGKEFDFYRLCQIIGEKAREKEREACAKVCDSWSLKDSLAADMAKEIRSRSSEH